MGKTGAGARFAWAFCGLTLVLIISSVALAVPNRYDLWRLEFLLTVASAALVGALISSRQPRNPVGWFVLGHAFCFSLGEFGRQYAIYGVLTEPGALPFASVMVWPTYWVWYPGLILMVVFLPLYFPDGRLVSDRWRWIVWLGAFVGVAATVLAMVQPDDAEAPGIPNPLGVESLDEGLGLLSGVFEILLSAGWPILGAAATASLVVRFRRSRDEERQQIKWVAYAAVLLIVSNIASQLLPDIQFAPVIGEIFLIVTLESLWVAIAVAILKYRLYDIDVIVNRTLVYIALTAALALVYIGSVVLLQQLFRAITGGESSLAVVASTLAIAALFNPLRHRIQSFIDRRFYRRKYDARRTLEAFSATLRNETDLQRLGDHLVGVVGETMQPEHVSLWLRPDGGAKGKQSN